MDSMPMEELAEAEIRAATNLSELSLTLEHLLNAGVAIFGGRLMFIRKRVDRINGLRIEIYPDEHPPPHFHLKGGDVDATFSILDCALLTGTIDRGDHNLVRWWFRRGRPVLVRVWNETRPTDCPVGPIVEPVSKPEERA